MQDHTTAAPQSETTSDEPRKRCTNPNCERAGQLLPLSEFYRDKHAADGYTYRCKKCMNADKMRYMRTEAGKESKRKYQQSEKGKAAFARHNHSEKGREHSRIRTARRRARLPHKEKARKAISLAVRSGILPKAKTLLCHNCGNPAKEYHHYLGYEPEHHLDVIPVCKPCHTQIHLSDNHWLK